MTLPSEPAKRKEFPVATGVVDYFPDALAAVAEVSYVGNEQHNPGSPLHWDRAKSTDEADALMRHFVQRGTLDSDGMRHSAKVAWRALALLQKEIEGEGSFVLRPGARVRLRTGAWSVPESNFLAGLEANVTSLAVGGDANGNIAYLDLDNEQYGDCFWRVADLEVIG